MKNNNNNKSHDGGSPFKKKPNIIIRNVGMCSYGKIISQLCSNCLHEHEGKNICYENGICKCSDGNGKDLGYFSGFSDEYKKILQNAVVIKEFQVF